MIIIIVWNQVRVWWRAGNIIQKAGAYLKHVQHGETLLWEGNRYSNQLKRLFNDPQGQQRRTDASRQQNAGERNRPAQQPAEPTRPNGWAHPWSFASPPMRWHDFCILLCYMYMYMYVCVYISKYRWSLCAILLLLLLRLLIRSIYATTIFFFYHPQKWGDDWWKW
jgi:hypothetical protein